MTKKILVSFSLAGAMLLIDSMRPPGITGDGRLFRAGISRHSGEVRTGPVCRLQ